MLAWVVCTLSLAQPLTFEDALSLAERAPALASHARGVAARKALADTVPWVTSNPSLQVQPGVRRSNSGASGPELYLGVTQELSLSGAGTTRRAAAQGEVSADEAELASRRRSARLTVAQAWLSSWASRSALVVAREEHALTHGLLASVERGAAAGGFTRVDVAVTRAYVGEAHLSVLALEGEAFARGLVLARSLGSDTGALPEVAAVLPDVPVPPQAPSLVDAASTATPVTAAKAAEVAARAHGDELEASRGTSLQVGALGWREGGGDLAAVATLQVTLPAFERAQRERSAVASQLEQARGRVETALVEERLERRDALHELEHTAEVRKVLEDELLPAASEAVEGLARRFTAGEVTAQELLLGRRTLASTKARLIRARADEVFARFRVQVLAEEVSR